MKSLFINTVDQNLVFALKTGLEFKILKGDEKVTQTEQFFFVLKKILGNIKLRDLDFIVVLSGPGSFTGIRLGLSFVKGIAIALSIPVIVLNNFEAIYLSLNKIDIDDFLITIKCNKSESFVVNCNKDKGVDLKTARILDKDKLVTNTLLIVSDIEINPSFILDKLTKNFDKSKFIQKPINATYIKPHYAVKK